MKNLYLLPTDKPSRLQQFEGTNGVEFQLCSKDEFFNKGVNIHITNDEEIKTNDYYITGKFVWQMKYPQWGEEGQGDCKKIILTTDQDLISDGIQAIDDAFLNRFVESPDFDEVEIIKEPKNFFNLSQGWEYIIYLLDESQYYEAKKNNKKAIINAMYEAHSNRKKLNKLEPEQKCTCDDNSSCNYCEEQESIQILKEAKEQAMELTSNKEDIEHLEWLYNRMLNVHGENENYDYMIRFKNIIDKFKNK
jgi:hypothetical protein